MTDLTTTIREFSERLDHETKMLQTCRRELNRAIHEQNSGAAHFWESELAKHQAIYRSIEGLAASLHILADVVETQTADARKENA